MNQNVRYKSAELTSCISDKPKDSKETTDKVLLKKTVEATNKRTEAISIRGLSISSLRAARLISKIPSKPSLSKTCTSPQKLKKCFSPSKCVNLRMSARAKCGLVTRRFPPRRIAKTVAASDLPKSVLMSGILQTSSALTARIKFLNHSVVPGGTPTKPDLHNRSIDRIRGFQSQGAKAMVWYEMVPELRPLDIQVNICLDTSTPDYFEL